MLTPVTQQNYYDPAIQMEYMGSTQFKAFQRCEAAALAQLLGEYSPATTPALLIGGYVDAHYAGEMEQYREAHPEIFKRDGSLKSEFVHANKIIERMERSRLYSLLMSGRKQVIKTGFIAGVPFKIRIDSLIDAKTCQTLAEEFPGAAPALELLDGAIVDQKVLKDFSPIWSDELTAKVPFVEAWGYDTQGAIYQDIEGRMLPFIIAAGTKEDEPDLGAFYIPYDDLQNKLAEVEDNAPRYQAIKEGKIEPNRCERCPYCRATKRLTGIIAYNEMEDK